jgi:hypothetical protein
VSGYCADTVRGWASLRGGRTRLATGFLLRGRADVLCASSQTLSSKGNCYSKARRLILNRRGDRRMFILRNQWGPFSRTRGRANRSSGAVAKVEVRQDPVRCVSAIQVLGLSFRGSIVRCVYIASAPQQGGGVTRLTTWFEDVHSIFCHADWSHMRPGTHMGTMRPRRPYPIACRLRRERCCPPWGYYPSGASTIFASGYRAIR